MVILEQFMKQYDLWAYLFAIISGTLCYIIIRFGEWLFFIIRTFNRIRHLNVNCFIQRDTSNYPCKLYIQFRNWTNTTILMKIEGFKLSKGIDPDPKSAQDSSSKLIEIKFIEESLNVDSIIRHGEDKSVWIPLDPQQKDEFLNNALQRGKIGKLKAEILWFNEKPRLVRYRPKIRRL